MKNFSIIFILLELFSLQLLSNGSAGTEYTYETRFIIDMPNAGMLPKYGYNINSRISGNGNTSIEFLASPFKNFLIGIAYSSSNLLGDSEPDIQGIPGFDIRYRIVNETMTFPAIVLGVRTQGAGFYVVDFNRFTTLSPGVFVALSKNFKWFLGDAALHGGINYSFESNPKDRFPNVYLGTEFSLGPFASGIAEANLNIDDPNKLISSKKGLLNAGVRFSITKSITIDLLFRDILKRRNNALSPDRSLNFEFIGKF